MLFQTCICFFHMSNTQEDTLKKFEEPNSWSPLTSIVGKLILWMSMGTINCLITSILQNIFFYFQHNKETHTGLENVHFWVNDPFKHWNALNNTNLFTFVIIKVKSQRLLRGTSLQSNTLFFPTHFLHNITNYLHVYDKDYHPRPRLTVSIACQNNIAVHAFRFIYILMLL